MRHIVGYVIVAADGMIADAKGVMPESIRNPADQAFFQDGLDRVAAIVHGRHSHEGGPRAARRKRLVVAARGGGVAAIVHGRHPHEGGPRAARRKRLVVTRQVAATAPDPDYPNALLWNPTGIPLEQAIDD